MSDTDKKLGHLFDVEDLAKSVLRGVEVKALCGYARSFTREDFPCEWGDACAECVKGSAAHNDGEVRFMGPSEWTDIVERAFLSATAPRTRARITGQIIGSTITWDWPPAA